MGYKSKWQKPYQMYSSLLLRGVEGSLKERMDRRYDVIIHRVLEAFPRNEAPDQYIKRNIAALSGHKDLQACYEDFRSSRWMHIVNDLWSELQGAKEEGIAEDVYHAALKIALFSEQWNEQTVAQSVLDRPQVFQFVRDSNLAEVFRGQTDFRWRLVPQMGRTNTDSVPLEDSAIQTRWADLQRVIHELDLAFPGYPEESLLAIAQHFSGESNVGTWMLDVTTDPFVALFFASYGGKTGATGAVYRLCRNELAGLGAGPGSILGDLKLVTVPGVLRLHRQRGMFIEAPRLDIVDLYMPFCRLFSQHEGLHFEDPIRGITAAQLLVDQPDLASIVRSRRPVHGSTGRVALPDRFGKPWHADDFAPYIAHRVGQNSSGKPVADAEILALATFHAALANEIQLPSTERSIRRLRNAVDAMCGERCAHDQRRAAYAYYIGRASGNVPGYLSRLRNLLS